mgnify:FL=1
MLREGAKSEGRFPHGKRGLKCSKLLVDFDFSESLPPREAWIEIDYTGYNTRPGAVASPTGSVD